MLVLLLITQNKVLWLWYETKLQYRVLSISMFSTWTIPTRNNLSSFLKLVAINISTLIINKEINHWHLGIQKILLHLLFFLSIYPEDSSAPPFLSFNNSMCYCHNYECYFLNTLHNILSILLSLLRCVNFL